MEALRGLRDNVQNVRANAYWTVRSGICHNYLKTLFTILFRLPSCPVSALLENRSSFLYNHAFIISFADDPVLELLKSMGPSSIDAEIRCLGPSAGGDIRLLELFMLFIEHQIGTRRDFELTEAFLALFLKVMSDIHLRPLFAIEYPA